MTSTSDLIAFHVLASGDDLHGAGFVAAGAVALLILGAWVAEKVRR